MSMNIIKIILFILCFNCHCGSSLSNKKINKNENPHLIQLQSPIKYCGTDGFTKSQSEHIIVEFKEPFIVKCIQGRIMNTENDYGWSKDSRVLFEIRIKDEKSIIEHVFADERGVFKMEGVAEGEYCFKATINGWQSVVGIIILSNNADPKSEIVFQMALGV